MVAGVERSFELTPGSWAEGELPGLHTPLAAVAVTGGGTADEFHADIVSLTSPHRLQLRATLGRAPTVEASWCTPPLAEGGTVVLNGAGLASPTLVQVPGNNPLVRRMQGFGTTIFAEMSALAVATGSINLGQGFPDTDGPPNSWKTPWRPSAGGTTSTRPVSGIPELRGAVSEHHRRCYQLDYDPESEVLVTAGATEAVTAAVMAFADQGDEVVVFEPYYDSYAACIALAGARRRTVLLRRQDVATGSAGASTPTSWPRP